MILLWAALSMALKDGLGVLLVIAEARGRAIFAGALDAASDLAIILTTLFGAGQVIEHGWDLKSIEVVATMVVVSFGGTVFWTKIGRRITEHKD